VLNAATRAIRVGRVTGAGVATSYSRPSFLRCCRTSAMVISNAKTSSASRSCSKRRARPVTASARCSAGVSGLSITSRSVDGVRFSDYLPSDMCPETYADGSRRPRRFSRRPVRGRPGSRSRPSMTSLRVGSTWSVGSSHVTLVTRHRLPSEPRRRPALHYQRLRHSGRS
jgi:hypothetical protein